MHSLILVSDAGSSGYADWSSQWQRQYPDTTLLLKNEEGPSLQQALKRLSQAIFARPHSVLVGHGVGAILIAHLAARLVDLPIAGALLVAPTDVEMDGSGPEHARSFGPIPIEPFDFLALVAASSNDPYMDFARARILANLWEAAFLDLGSVGHMNAASGHGPWPGGLQLLERFRTPRQQARPKRRESPGQALHVAEKGSRPTCDAEGLF